MSNPISEFNEELEAFRRLSPCERIEQLTLTLETDEAFVAKFKDAFNAWEKNRRRHQRVHGQIHTKQLKWSSRQITGGSLEKSFANCF